MKQRGKVSGARAKARRPKAAKLSRDNVPKAALRSQSYPSGEEMEVARLARELTEAREQQTATSEVLKVISSSPDDLQPVFDAILKNAARICGAKFGNIYRWDGDALVLVATHNTPPALAEQRRRSPHYRPSLKTGVGRLVATKTAVQVVDAAAEQAYIEQHPAYVAAVELGGVRTYLAVPMLKENELIGAFILYRQEVRPFTDQQIALLTDFAAQAVIAIENARLLNELRQRTTDLTERTADLSEALEQQTATSEVLQVISSSPGDLEPVFATILEKAVRICDTKFGNIYRWDGEALQLVASHNTPPAFAEFRRRTPYRDPSSQSGVGRMLATKTAVQVADVPASKVYIEHRLPEAVAAVELGGVRTFLAVPMLKDRELIGALMLFRQEVRPFTDKQIALVTGFAAQAVIAIENTRLLNELRQRTTDLTESLEQQTATSEVLGVISSSPGDLEPVFATMLEKAVRICDAKFGNIYRWDGDALRVVAAHNTPAAFAEFRRRSPLLRPDPETALGRMLATKTVIHIDDAAALETYVQKRVPFTVAAVELGGARTVLLVPMLKDNELIGALSLFRQEVRPFTEKQIVLVQSFAAQAVIAIENARLLNELRQRTSDLTEALEQQMATSEVLQVITSSTGNLQPVFVSMLQKALHICEAKFGMLALYEDDLWHTVAVDATSLAEDAPGSKWGHWLLAEPRRFGSETALGRLAQTKGLIHIPDLGRDVESTGVSPTRAAFLETGARSLLAAPLLKEGKLIGAIAFYRQELRPFTDKQIALIENFATQAVIAIENARLLKELRDRTDEVEKLNKNLEQRVADQVGEIERMGKLRRFLPPQVADLIVASGTEKQLESHRREITALFCDLRGFTGFTESADAEDVMALLRAYHAAIGQIVIKYNGTLERYAGDGVMVIFNDPVPVENPALQAVLMALEVRDAIGALTETWRRWGHEIGFGIGIAHGFATLGTIGFEGRFDYAAIGTVSNVASRLCDEAKPGQILISPRVLTKVENAVKVEPVGEFELKGIRRPFMAYSVLSANALS